MDILHFEKKHIEEAKAIALANYYEEQRIVKELPYVEKIPDLSDFAENGLGVAAFENGKMIGFLCCCRPWDNAFDSTAKGTFSPIHAHGTVAENRERIYKKLYQAAAEKWVDHQITYHVIAMYAHDIDALRAFFMYGFGVRCVDAVRSTENLDCVPQDNLILKELPKEEVAQVRGMRKMLSDHLGRSPCFMPSSDQDFHKWLARAERRNSIVYVAERNQVPAAFIEITDDGENFVTETESMKNICGAFCLPQYRGTGVFWNLLNYSLTQLRQQGIRNLGVDFESFNPTASGAWNKYFTPYTYSVVRRIDECALKNCN